MLMSGNSYDLEITLLDGMVGPSAEKTQRRFSEEHGHPINGAGTK